MAENILLVDDDREFRQEFKDFLSGYKVQEAANGREALTLLGRANEIDLVILDVNMPGMNGIDVLNEIKRTDPDLGIIILTAYSTKDVAVEALKGHADDYIEKTMDLDKAREVIEGVLEKRKDGENLDSVDLKGKMEKVKRFVERNCFRKTNLEDAAKAICLSPKYLSRIFKAKLGVSFGQYKLKIKLGKAKELLLKAGYNVNQIAEKLGYENPESFIRQFKKFTGSTPTGYRKKNNRTKSKKK